MITTNQKREANHHIPTQNASAKTGNISTNKHCRTKTRKLLNIEVEKEGGKSS